ncbi:MAG: TerB family tellurite resistance protein [Cytophagia bacterium]|nr:TerB family tellurite resistance protein [Cytophagia bacterium]
MQGFFEHQYLTYKKNHIKSLLALANADGHMHDSEVALLFKIGQKYGLKDWQVQNLVDSTEKFELTVPDNFNDRMNLLYDLLLMVYADGVVEQREIDFCEDVAKRFQMKKGIVNWLIKIFEKGTPPPADEWIEIKREAQERFEEK